MDPITDYVEPSKLCQNATSYLRAFVDMTVYLLNERGYFWWNTQVLAANEFASSVGCWGTLTVSEDGDIGLELDGHLDSHTSTFPDFPEDRPITKSILGLLKKTSRKVFLHELWIDGGEIRSHSFSYIKYRASHALVSAENIHRPTYSPHFRKMAIELSEYEGWVGRGQLKVQRQDHHIVVEHARASSRVYRVIDRAVRLSRGIQGSEDAFSSREAQFKEFSRLDTKFCRAMSISEVLQEHKLLEDFLVVLTTSENAIGWPVVYTTSCRSGSTLYFHRLKRPHRAFHEGDCWVTLRDIDASFGTVLRAWLNKSKTLGPGFYMYTGNHRGFDLYLENRFTNLIFGLESLHRRLYGSKLNPSLELKIERILDSVHSSIARKDLKWLAARLQNIEPSLEDRLNEVIGASSTDLEPNVLRNFLKTCSHLRHDVAHRGEIATKQDPLRHYQLSKFTAALDVLYRVRILREIGVPDAVLHSIFNEKSVSYAIKRTFYQAGLLADDPQVALRRARLANLPAHLRQARDSYEQ